MFNFLDLGYILQGQTSTNLWISIGENTDIKCADQGCRDSQEPGYESLGRLVVMINFMCKFLSTVPGIQ